MSKKSKKPPRLASRLLSFLTFYEREYSITGDCSEEFKYIERRKGKTAAIFWLWGQIFCAALSYLKISFLFGGVMIKTTVKTALRGLKKHKSYFFINMTGLAIGMVSFLIISLYVRHELSYDRFHQNADNIYLVLRGEKDAFMAPTSKLLGPALKEVFPDVIQTTCFSRVPGSEKLMVRFDDKSFEEDISLADSEFFEMFDFPFLEGNPGSAFPNPNSMLMTERTAQKYFGGQAPLGKTIQLFMFGQALDMKITGILEDMPSHSFFKSDILVSYDIIRLFGLDWDRWDNQVLKTFICLREGSDLHEIPDKIKDVEIRRHPGARFGNLSYDLLPVTKIHLYGGGIKFLSAEGDIRYVTIFGTAALIILLIAGINYMNLSTAFSLKRTNEVGVRKIAGASRSSIVRQFLGETMVLSFGALVMAVLMTQLFLPVFNRISGKSLSIPFGDPLFIGGAFVMALVTGLLSGYYPALFLSRFKPLVLMKTRYSHNVKGTAFRKGLLVFQFSLSIILIFGTLVVYRQLFFIRNSSLGYDKDQILCVKVRGDISRSYEAFKNELLNSPDVLSLCRSEPLDAHVLSNTDGVVWKDKTRNVETYFRLLRTDYDFSSTFGIKLDQGRYYSEEISSDATEAYVINETAAKAMEMESPLGENLTLWRRKGRIIGVVKDFHFGSFHNAIEPLILVIPDEQYAGRSFRLLSVRFRPDRLLASKKYIEEKWMSFFPDVPFDYYFVDDALNIQYQAEERMGTLFKYFTILAVFIACLGLYGLTALSAEQKIKQIGIRKVLGASVSNITVLLSKEYLAWVFMANLFAWPAAWFVMNKWLQSFAYRTSIGWWIFLIAGGAAFVIALLTVCALTMRAARKNPVDSLRYE
ncbi:MAG: ABC transporter permease [Candidatus Aminicenantes bacterium]|nr:ABC transporter permease [Candidatus Aminicenantes bacterium]